MTPVYAELHRWMGQPFVWGETNCCFVLGDWIARVRGVDPFAGDRFTFTDPGSCQRATGYFSDPLGVIGARMAAAGLEPVTAPATGDVALVRVPDERHPVGALWTGLSWAMKGPRGVSTRHPAQVQVLAIWGVDYAG